MRAAGPALLVERIVKNFGSRTLIDAGGVTFAPGELHLLVGDNGTGKTTFLKILSGLEVADEVSFSLNGRAFRSGRYPDAMRREIVYVHQHPYLFSTSITDNIAYGLKQRAIGGDARDAAVAEALQWAGLDGLHHVAPKRLSGGEKQRVALARALVLKAPVMLIDEPTANLDSKARIQIKALLETLRAEGRIVIIATHDPEMTKLPGATVWSLADGRITRREP
jgi:tungstate transport system ATP-binding protein